MAVYTLEVRQIHESNNMCVFDFDYDFYDEELKTIFEQKFIEHYYFNEICAETVQRWKFMLKARLNKIMPYYTQLYHTQLRTKDIDFMLNKDLKETTIRDVARANNSTSNASKIDTTATSTTASSQSNSKSSELDNGNAYLSDDSLTSASSDTGSTSSNSNNNLNSNENSTTTDNGTEKEEITLLSQGNIGITSSADLLSKWREVIINIDELIINDCYDLFMLIY